LILMSESLGDGHFIGSLRGAREVSGLTLAETEYSPGLSVPAHAHHHALCSLVLDGSFTERVGVRRAHCSPGSLIYHPPDEPHSHDFHGEGGRCFNVQFGASWTTRLGAFGIHLGDTPKDLHRSKAGWLARHLHHEFRSGDTAAALAIEGLALALISEISRTAGRSEKGAKPGWLLRAVEHLHAHALEQISLTELAASLDVDPTHLGRTFREHYGCTMTEYVRKLRIEFAQHELATTNRPLSSIAYAAGFADQAHFTRVFKQLTGVTPAAYRMAASPR
jgi:AraC family transcriptional regulator